MLLRVSRVIQSFAFAMSIPPQPDASVMPNSVTNTGVPAAKAVRSLFLMLS